MSEIVSVINYKGGVGKTTLTLQIGVGLVTLFQKRILLVDLDPQCSLSLSTVDEHYWADRVEKQGSVREMIQSFYESEKPECNPDWIIENALDRAWDSMPGKLEGLDLLPGHLDLPDYEMKLVAKKPGHMNAEEYQLKRYMILKDALAKVRKKYDMILCDCPPNIYMVARNAIIASDYFFVPTIPDFISCYGIPFILQHIQNMQNEVRERGVRTSAKFLGIVRNRVRQAGGNLVREHEEQSKKLAREYESLLMDSMIMDRIGVAELLGTRQNIFSTGSERTEGIRDDFKELTQEVVKRIENLG
ncbi:MAG TPA: AAA family ATPase [Leptospiraceae bacterium]|nr:AAA family ATPase [Leptospiraceae bacterium]